MDGRQKMNVEEETTGIKTGEQISRVPKNVIVGDKAIDKLKSRQIVTGSTVTLMLEDKSVVTIILGKFSGAGGSFATAGKRQIGLNGEPITRISTVRLVAGIERLEASLKEDGKV